MFHNTTQCDEYSAAIFIGRQGTERDSTTGHCTAATSNQCYRNREVIKQQKTKLNLTFLRQGGWGST